MKRNKIVRKECFFLCNFVYKLYIKFLADVLWFFLETQEYFFFNFCLRVSSFMFQVFTQQQRKKEQRRQKSSQLPAHGEVQRMEQSLLKLLQEFNSGELRGFDSAHSLDEMESVRDQQEALGEFHKCVYVPEIFVQLTVRIKTK